MMSSPTSVEHLPVLLEAVLERLACRPGGRYVDGTLGGAGYAEAILQASGPDGLLLGLDWDCEAVRRAENRLAPYRGRFILERAAFDQLGRVLRDCGWKGADGIVLDLGLSTFQLSDAGRGFSFQQEGPLDMRMDGSEEMTAADIVNKWSRDDLSALLRNLGEERFARRIAGAIVRRRRQRPFTGTLELARLVQEVVPGSADTRRIHPATRTFLALRLAVNRELEVLERFLDGVLDWLRPGGRLCIVSFHSLEDRLVKNRFRTWAKSCRCPRQWPQCRCEGRPLVRLLTRKVIRPDEDETARNPRARSGRLRAVEKI